MNDCPFTEEEVLLINRIVLSCIVLNIHPNRCRKLICISLDIQIPSEKYSYLSDNNAFKANLISYAKAEKANVIFNIRSGKYGN